jgi:hypothetical protein
MGEGAVLTTMFPTLSAPAGWAQDARAVVDARLRVRGIDGLRVIDASIMPNITSGNTNAPHPGAGAPRHRDAGPRICGGPSELRRKSMRDADTSEAVVVTEAVTARVGSSWCEVRLGWRRLAEHHNTRSGRRMKAIVVTGSGRGNGRG